MTIFNNYVVMKKNFYILLFIPLLFSCTQNDNKAGAGNTAVLRVKKEVMDIATDYVAGKFKEAKKTVAKDGVITIGDNQISYVINPSKIVIGLIDQDANDDAIVSIDYYHGQSLVLTEHLILIYTDGQLKLNRVVESNMNILSIKDRVITAEIYTHSRNSPLRDCSACKEVVRYQFKQGELIRIDK